MRQKIINIYRFSELSEDAQRHAWEYNQVPMDDYNSEFRTTLKAFEDIFDIKVYRYDVETRSFSFIIEQPAVDCPEDNPLRLARFVWNHYADYILKGKYFSTRGTFDENGKYHYKFRHSKIMIEMTNCPLTGMVYDQDILQPVVDCLHYKRFFDTYEDLMNECLYSFFKTWLADLDYQNSFECFEEIATMNEWEFYENGERYR